MNSIDSAIKQNLKLMKYAQNTVKVFPTNKFIYPINSSEALVNPLNDYIQLLQTQQHETNLRMINSINSSIKLMIDSMQESNLQLLHTMNENIFSITQETLKNISSLNFEFDIPENKLDSLNTDVNSLYESIEQVCIDKNLEENFINISAENNLSPHKNISTKHKPNIYELITIIITLLGFLYQIYNGLETDKVNEQLLRELHNINSSIQNISK